MKRGPGLDPAWGCLIVPAAFAFLLWALWPSADDRQHWREITADLRAP